MDNHPPLCSRLEEHLAGGHVVFVLPQSLDRLLQPNPALDGRLKLPPGDELLHPIGLTQDGRQPAPAVS